jgi:3-deoxy-manno-octulosonate cytidylyltransferase (CMP-KDO synthetase)
LHAHFITSKFMKILGIIPARYASTRFPGKPLVEIGGKSMIQRVYNQAGLAVDKIFVATDDERIENHVISFGGNVVMTSHNHRSGTDRCAEALEKISEITREPYDVVINIQGDEPFIQPSQLRLLAGCLIESGISIATLVKIIDNNKDLVNPNIPKVAINIKQEAMLFSRSVIPYLRNAEQAEWQTLHTYYKHIGIYAYRSQLLKILTRLVPSSLELAESLEQNRWLENGYTIKVAVTDMETIAIDTPEDLKAAEAYLKKPHQE